MNFRNHALRKRSCGTGPSATFTVTAVAAGKCPIVVSASRGQSVTETIYVTTTGGTVRRAAECNLEILTGNF